MSKTFYEYECPECDDQTNRVEDADFQRFGFKQNVECPMCNESFNLEKLYEYGFVFEVEED